MLYVCENKWITWENHMWKIKMQYLREEPKEPCDLFLSLIPSCNIFFHPCNLFISHMIICSVWIWVLKFFRDFYRMWILYGLHLSPDSQAQVRHLVDRASVYLRGFITSAFCYHRHHELPVCFRTDFSTGSTWGDYIFVANKCA